jgi:hypothetical protein
MPDPRPLPSMPVEGKNAVWDQQNAFTVYKYTFSLFFTTVSLAILPMGRAEQAASFSPLLLLVLSAGSLNLLQGYHN